MVAAQQIDNHFITPYVMQRAVKLHPVPVMLALLAGGTLVGFFGLLLAVPATAAVKILIGHLWRTHVLGEPIEEIVAEQAAADAKGLGVIADVGGKEAEGLPVRADRGRRRGRVGAGSIRRAARRRRAPTREVDTAEPDLEPEAGDRVRGRVGKAGAGPEPVRRSAVGRPAPGSSGTAVRVLARDRSRPHPHHAAPAHQRRVRGQGRRRHPRRRAVQPRRRPSRASVAKLLDDDGSLRRFVNVFVADDDVRYLKGLDTEVPDGETVSIIPAVAGG